MAIDPATLACTQHNWLQTSIQYEGTARAEFTSPPGVIEGSASVCVNAAGRCRVRIKIEKIDAPDATNFALGSGSAPLGTFLVHGMSNPCSSLTVKTSNGTFTGGDRIVHDGLPFSDLRKEIAGLTQPRMSSFRATWFASGVVLDSSSMDGKRHGSRWLVSSQRRLGSRRRSRTWRKLKPGSTRKRSESRLTSPTASNVLLAPLWATSTRSYIS